MPYSKDLRGHRVRPEDVDVDADAAVAVLHPVAVERLAAVVLVRHGVVVVHPLVHVLRRDRRPARLRVPERMRSRRLRDQERLVGIVDQDDRRLVLALRPVGGAVVELRSRIRHGLVGRPRQLALIDPVLCVDRLQQRMVRGVRRDFRACGRRERHRQGEERKRGEPACAPVSGLVSHLGPSLSPDARRRQGRMSPANPPADRSRRDRNTPQEWNSVQPRGSRDEAASVRTWIRRASITTSRSRS